MKIPWYMRQQLPVVLVAGLGGLFTVVDLACAQPWAATPTPMLSWKALAASADGTKLVAAANTSGGYFASPLAPIYVSTNAGATWIQTSTPSNSWSSVACSADGTKLVASATPFGHHGVNVGDGLIYTSPDLGTTWMLTSAPSNNWTSVASSADGARLVAVAALQEVWNGTNYDYVFDATIYSSRDSGATWSRTSAPTNNWTSVASSADGTKLVAVAGLERGNADGLVYTSSDSGVTWTPTSAPINNWTCVASSADGAKLVAVAGFVWENADGLVYTSSDSGLNWTPTSAPINYWSAVASSADGTKLVVASIDSGYGGDGLIYTSGDSGVTWTATGALPGRWTALASSADGYRVVAGGESFWGRAPLCTLPYSGPWRLADAPPNDWRSVAASADGTKLVAVAGTDPWHGGDGLIYTSGNSGAIWAPTTAPSNHWTSVASSADGAQLVATAEHMIYTSSDSGATWALTTAPYKYWYSVASSADGTTLVATADGMIYTSSDSGATWALTTAPTNHWRPVASSTDGTKLVAVAGTEEYYRGDGSYARGDGLIYTSGDSGATWSLTTAPSNLWNSVASSADGAKLVAVGYQMIYTSSDSGATWSRHSAPSNDWTLVASSADGAKLVAVAVPYEDDGINNHELSLHGERAIYRSLDSGATWVRSDSTSVWPWSAVAISADGSNIVAAGPWFISTLRSPAPAPPLPPSPQLAVGLSGGTVGLSWLVPSSHFALQQNSDLGSANWMEVPTPPTLDLTNLQQRLTLTPSLGSSYFRLKQQ